MEDLEFQGFEDKVEKDIQQLKIYIYIRVSSFLSMFSFIWLSFYLLIMF